MLLASLVTLTALALGPTLLNVTVSLLGSLQAAELDKLEMAICHMEPEVTVFVTLFPITGG